MTQVRTLEIYVDGASRGNPGQAAIGVSARCDGQIAFELAESIGETTNNVAEYRALIRGLEESLAKGYRAVSVCSDSELLVRQIEGKYRVRAVHLQPLLAQVQALMARFMSFAIRAIPREQNRHADALANRALDQKK